MLGDNISLKKYVQPIAKFQNNYDFLVPQTLADRVYRVVTASSHGASNTIFQQCQSPHPNDHIDRFIPMMCKFRVNVTGTRVDGNLTSHLLNSGEFAMRDFPLQRIIQTLGVTINGFAVNQTPYLYHHIMARALYNYKNEHDKESFNTGTSFLQDNATKYSDLKYTMRNVLAGYNDSNFEMCGRGGHFKISNVVANNTSFQFDVEVVEGLTIYGFLNHKHHFDDSHGLTKVNDMSVNVTWVSGYDMARGLLSVMDGVVNNLNVNVSFLQNPILEFAYVSSGILGNVEKHPVYPYTNIRYNAQTLSNVAPGSFTIESQSQIYQTIPDYFIICVAKSDRTKTITDTDSFCAINNISVIFNNRSGILASASARQLYYLSKQCGLQGINYMDWVQEPRQFVNGSTVQNYYGCGSMLVLRPDSLSFLQESECSGMVSNSTFQFKLTCTNNFSEPSNEFELKIIAVYNGYLQVHNQSARTELAPINKLTYLEMDADPNLTPHLFHGGGVWGDIKSGLATVFNEVIKPVATTVAPMLAKKFLGLGSQQMDGGRVASRSELYNRLSRR